MSALLVGGAGLAVDSPRNSLDPGVQRSRAVLDALKAQQANPNDAGLKNDLGCLMAREGAWHDALREFDEAADLDRGGGRSSFNAGLARGILSDWRGARSRFQLAVKRQPGNWPAWWMLGFAEEQLGNTSAAVEAYRASVRGDASLFDVAVNPFAGGTRVDPKFLAETSANRPLRALAAASGKATDPGRAAAFLQKTGTTVPAPAPRTQGQSARREEVPPEPTAPPPTLPPPPAPTPDPAPGIHPGVIQPRPRPGGEGGNSGGPADIQSARPLPSTTPPAPRQ